MIDNTEDLIRSALAVHGATFDGFEPAEDDGRTLSFYASSPGGGFAVTLREWPTDPDAFTAFARDTIARELPQPGDEPDGDDAPAEPEAPATRALRLEDAGGQFAIVDIPDDRDRAIVAAAVGVIAVAPDSGGRSWALERLAGPDAVALAAVILRDVFPVPA